MGTIKIISDSDAPFKDRIEAGALLAGELKAYKDRQAVVLGIPRGGVVVANEIARLLGSELDIVLSRKLGAPGNPELAIGAVAEDGKLFLHDFYARSFSDKGYLEEEKTRQILEIKKRVKRYRAVKPKVKLAGRDVIITDDGLATGSTMQAALWSARRERPRSLVAAVPVAPEDTVNRLAEDADEILVLRLPQSFSAVGQFYKYFDQVTDEEVLSILKNSIEYNVK